MLLEYLAIGLYLIALGWITWSSAKKGDVDDFLTASHSATWKQLAISFFSSSFSSYNIAVTLTFSFLFGPYVIIIFLGVLVAFAGIYFVAQKYERTISKRHFSNIIDLFVDEFDNRVATILHLAFLVVLLLFVSLQFFVNTSIFKELLGWSDITSALVVGAIVYIYISIGGLKTEIMTDAFQGVLMLMIVVLAFLVDTSSLNTATVTGMLSNTTALVGALSLGLVQLMTFLVQPEMWQRVAAAKDMSHLKKGMLGGWFLLLVMIVPVIIIGIAVNASGDLSSTDNLFLEVVNEAAPSAYIPFLLVGLFAAFMSSLDSSIFAAASQLGKYGLVITKKDTEENFESDTSIDPTARRTRVSIALIVILCLIGSLFFISFLQGVFGLISVMTVISATLICSLIFKFSSNEMLFATIFGIVAFLVSLFSGYITSNAITVLYPSFALIGVVLIQQFLSLLVQRTR